MSTKGKAREREPTPSVRAYEYEDKIIVKYYDDGLGESLTCPSCFWFGSVVDAGKSDPIGFSEFPCPECGTRLAMVSWLVGSEEGRL